MQVGLETRAPCECGYLIRYIACGTAVINKRSMRVRTTLGAAEHLSCPECGTPVPRQMPDGPWKLLPGDAEKVAAYRVKKWGDAA